MPYVASKLRDCGSFVIAAVLAAPAAAQSPLLSIDGQLPEVGFGTALANAGDVDGDGLTDLVIGAQFANAWRGAARVVSGADGSTIYTYVNEGQKSGSLDQYGRSVVGAGDLDGDGRADFAIAQDNVVALQIGGRLTTYRGSDGGVLHVLNGNTNGGNGFATGLANVGDVDGDGVDDLAVGY